jgi:hypothetical protein
VSVWDETSTKSVAKGFCGSSLGNSEELEESGWDVDIASQWLKSSRRPGAAANPSTFAADRHSWFSVNRCWKRIFPQSATPHPINLTHQQIHRNPIYVPVFCHSHRHFRKRWHGARSDPSTPSRHQLVRCPRLLAQHRIAVNGILCVDEAVASLPEIALKSAPRTPTTAHRPRRCDPASR